MLEINDPRELAGYIDHTLLKSDVTKEDIERLCQEANSYGFVSVCVNPFWVPVAREHTRSRVCAVVGFPLGAAPLELKIKEAAYCVREGADEIDMVMNISYVKDNNFEALKKEIEEVVQASSPAKVKVILETALLTDEEKVKAAQIAVSAGAEFVKTSTGFFGGATKEDVELLKKTVGDDCLIKASGGIRTKKQALEFISLGASRIGTSSGVKIVCPEEQ
ncbi:MAG TPA: deoxyribose-phosphate aldolase [Firmicutes bacterium]|nr:deoxyribose-phosphate aldolase [Bacillota bacterium]